MMDEKMNRPSGTSEKLIRFVTDRAGHDLRYAINAARIKRELGWEPSLTFEQGLNLTVDWYLSHESWLQHVVSGDYQKYYERQYLHR
jgi:dTDP-glucose 4,6-dehydratase